ncbi:hypothetical protein A9G11_10290 [Gilliamella sp. wkB108]|nr:hypothetical protein A9G11_10290 [Gilliamella apicola]
MIQKICVFTFVFIFSSCAFSSNDFSTVMSSFGNGNNNRYQNKSNKGKDNLESTRRLATAYINLANSLSSRDCNRLKQLYNLVKTKKTAFALDYDPYSDYKGKDGSVSNYKKFGCNTLTDDEINYNLLPKLFGKGVSLYKTAILSGDTESLTILLNRFKLQEIPLSHFITIARMEDKDLNDNPYVKFLIGQLYIDDYFVNKNPTKAVEYFKAAGDIQEHDLGYYLAFAKIEEGIESQDESLSKISFLNDENQNKTNHDDLIKQIEENLDPKDYPSMLRLSFYYAEDEKLNRAIEYFDIACTLEASRACELYKQQLKQPQKNKIYSLLRKFDKNNPDIKVSVAIAKWYEDLGKNLTAIYYYSYAMDKDPKLLLKMVKLLETANIEFSSELEMAIINTYIKYDSYIDNAEIKYKIFELYFYSSRSSDSVLEKQKISMYWLEKAAEAGHVLAKLKISDEYKSGRYIKQDFTKTLYWYNSYCNVFKENESYIYTCSPFIEKEKETSDLITKANNGDMEAQFNLGKILYDDVALYTTGLYYLKLAADQGHKEAKSYYHRYERRYELMCSMNFSG